MAHSQNTENSKILFLSGRLLNAVSNENVGESVFEGHIRVMTDGDFVFWADI